MDDLSLNAKLAELADETAALLAEQVTIKEHKRVYFRRFRWATRVICEAKEQMADLNGRSKEISRRLMAITMETGEAKAALRRNNGLRDSEKIRQERENSLPEFMRQTRELLGMDAYRKVWDAVRAINEGASNGEETKVC